MVEFCEDVGCMEPRIDGLNVNMKGASSIPKLSVIP